MPQLPPTTVVVNGDGSVTVDTEADTAGLYLNVRVANGVYAMGQDILPATVTPTFITPPVTAEVWGAKGGHWRQLSATSDPFTP